MLVIVRKQFFALQQEMGRDPCDVTLQLVYKLYIYSIYYITDG